MESRSPGNSGIYQFDGFIFDDEEGTFYVQDERIQLRAQAARFLSVLVKYPERTVSYDVLKEALGIRESPSQDRTNAIHGLGTELRKLLGDQERKEIIQNRANEGYRLSLAVNALSREQLPRRQQLPKRSRRSRVYPQRDMQKFGKRKFERALRAWSGIEFGMLARFLVDYYQAHGVSLFSYPSASRRRIVVPLYVRPAWQNLTKDTLVLTKNSKRENVKLPEYERAFFEQYQKIREQLGLLPMWDGQVFRLVLFQPRDPVLHLNFEHGSFFDAVACQYALEHELRLALTSGKTPAQQLCQRDSRASTTKLIEEFCNVRVVRIGVSNLLLLRSTRDTYRPVVRKRGQQSMGHAGDFDPVSSGVFDVSTDTDDIDFSLEHKVLKEVYEEVLGGVEVEREYRGLDPDFFYDRPGIADLKKMLKDGRADFRITGFCIDIIRIIPEITTLLVVRDESYYRKHRANFKVNLEYGRSSFCEIPRKIEDIDQYLAKQFPSVPGDARSAPGFDPMKWTLPGGFCFYQGLKRVVADGLL